MILPGERSVNKPKARTKQTIRLPKHAEVIKRWKGPAKFRGDLRHGRETEEAGYTQKWIK